MVYHACDMMIAGESGRPSRCTNPRVSSLALVGSSPSLFPRMRPVPVASPAHRYAATRHLTAPSALLSIETLWAS